MESRSSSHSHSTQPPFRPVSHSQLSSTVSSRRLSVLPVNLSLLHRPVKGLLQYSLAELLRLRFQWLGPPPALHRLPDIVRFPSRKYIHRGSRRGFCLNRSNTIVSFWSSSRRPSRNAGRSIDHRALAGLARAANGPRSSETAAVNFGLLNIRSLTGKGNLIQDILTDRKLDILCLNETWQTPGDFSQLNDSTPPGFVYISKPRDSGRGGVSVTTGLIASLGALGKVTLREVLPPNKVTIMDREMASQ
ncbi:uncharacterized protein LOC127597376 [Hippocampus zosterae]|uniref:uncharacterized protein LOC127597376 n=1 Tax=Hippocampus zosterae TaxID=109293 RepID=UPI00223D40F5|nr:uncharacterized protein LOC127597376 [Hippocampus zosterae]